MLKPYGTIKSGVAYAGPSMLDGAPIILILTSGSSNSKTGDLAQSWILRSDVSPVDAVRSGADSSICGDCKHGPGRGPGFSVRSCYVNVGQAPASIWRAYHRGVYPVLSAADIARFGFERRVRLGSYGDPAAVPVDVWRALVSGAVGHTGYTHQWRRPDAQALRSLCMASVDSAAELDQARALGWRTFRVRGADEPLARAEFVCPASDEADVSRPMQCSDCMACHGADGKRKGSPAIVVHGAFARRFNASTIQA